jgi:P-type Cu+ transporter
MKEKTVLGEVSATVIDPVCGMTIAPSKSAGHETYHAQTYYFCGESCAIKFRGNPEIFAVQENGPQVGKPGTNSDPPEKPVTQTGYTCPMRVLSAGWR